MSKLSNKIVNGNCLKEIKKIPDSSFDLVFADPPYNMQIGKNLTRPDSSKVNGVNDKWDQFNSFKDYDEFCKAWLKECKRILKDNGSIWVIGSYHNIFRLGYHLQNLNYWLLNDVIWKKNNSGFTNKKGLFKNEWGIAEEFAINEDGLWKLPLQYVKNSITYMDTR